MKRYFNICFLLLSLCIFYLFLTIGCDDGGGGNTSFPLPNSLATLIAQRGGKTPDGQATFFGFTRLRGPTNTGWVAFTSIEKISEDTFRLILYTANGGGLTEVARNGDTAPGGGMFRDFTQTIGVNDQAQVAFVGRIAESPDDEFGDTEGFYLGSYGVGIQEFVREGDAVPGGGTVFKLCIPGFLACAYEYGGPNESGQITFVAALKDTPEGDSDNIALYIADPSGITQLVRKGDPVPGGDGVFDDFFDPRGPNSSGQVAFLARISGTSGGDKDNEGIYLADKNGIVELARKGKPVPGGNGSIGDIVFLRGLNDNGQAAFHAILDGTSGGENDNEAIFTASVDGITELARKGEPAPGERGGTLDSFNNLTNPNESGEVAFNASIRNGDEDVPIDSGLFLAGPSGIVKLIRVGDPGPGGIGQFSGFALGRLNDSGQVIFRSRIFQGPKSAQGLYRVGSESSVTALAQAFQPAPPDGSKLYVTIDDVFQGPNNSGLAFYRATLMNADRTSTPDNIGVFLAQ